MCVAILAAPEPQASASRLLSTTKLTALRTWMSSNGGAARTIPKYQTSLSGKATMLSRSAGSSS